MTTHTVLRPKHIEELHLENKMSLKRLDFCREDINILQKRLEEIAQRNTVTEVTAGIEQFQNRFIRQREVNDELRHTINEHENELAKYAKNHPVAINHVLFKNNDVLVAEVNRYVELYEEMKKDFQKFLAKYL